MFQTFHRLVVSTAVAAALTSISAFSVDAQEGSMHGGDQMQKMHAAMQKSAKTKMPDAFKGAMPTLPGQDAFGAMAEIAAILSADPKTDWSKVNMRVLREHLVDMNRVTLDADARGKAIDGGLEIIVSGQGRTLKAIQNMVIAHAPQLDQLENWTAAAEKLPNGARLTVTSKDAKETARIRALGFFGLMASGAHHQPHHIGMAKGLMVHTL
ncbi:MAG: hypothetical protein O3A85_11740 [Proteobacteria bacterium]|nr:hypothetical protein [Pseudomonadota bacterium]